MGRIVRAALAALACAALGAQAQSTVSYSIEGPATVDATTQSTVSYTLLAHRSDGSVVPATGYTAIGSSATLILSYQEGAPNSFVVTGAGTVTLSYSDGFLPTATRQVVVSAPTDPGLAVSFDCTSEAAGPSAWYYRQRRFFGRASQIIPLCDTQVMLASTSYNQLQVWDLGAGNLLRTWQLPAKPLDVLRIPGTRIFVVKLDNGNMARVDATTGTVTSLALPNAVNGISTFEPGQVLSVSPAIADTFPNYHVVATVVDLATFTAVRSATFPVTHYFSSTTTPALMRYDASRHALYYAEASGVNPIQLSALSYDSGTNAFTLRLVGASASTSEVALSPDGNHVLHMAMNSPNGGNQVYVTTDFRGTDFAELGYFEAALWSADFRADNAAILGTDFASLYVFDVATHKARAAWPLPGDCSGGGVVKARWSATGAYGMRLRGCGYDWTLPGSSYTVIDWVQVPGPDTPMPPARADTGYALDGPDTIDASTQTSATYAGTTPPPMVNSPPPQLASASTLILSPAGNQAVVTGLGTVVLSYSVDKGTVEKMVRVTSGPGNADALSLDCTDESGDAAMTGARAKVLVAEATQLIALCHHQALVASFGLNRIQAIDVATGRILRNWPLRASPVAMARVAGTSVLIAALNDSSLARVDMATGAIDYATVPHTPYIVLPYESGKVLAIAQHADFTGNVTVAPAYVHGTDAYIVDGASFAVQAVGWPAAANSNLLLDAIAKYDPTGHFLYFSGPDPWKVMKLAFDAGSSSFVVSGSTPSLAQIRDFDVSPDGTRLAAPVDPLNGNPIALKAISTADMASALGTFGSGSFSGIRFRPDGAALLATSGSALVTFDTGSYATVAGAHLDGACCETPLLEWSGSHRYIAALHSAFPWAHASEIELLDWPAAQTRDAVTVFLGTDNSADPAAFYGIAQIDQSTNAIAPGGTVTFNDNGLPIPGCTNLPVVPTYPRCAITLQPGAHDITVSYSGDALFLPGTSNARHLVVSANYALAANGGVASASSQLSGDYPVAAINDGETAGANWTHGGGWADGTVNAWPDWVQVDFNGPKLIDHVVVYTVQDNYANPLPPVDGMAFTQYGITDFTVQGWDGAQWLTLGTVTGNTYVKRTVFFTPTNVTKIRVNVTHSSYYVSRITEVEAWGVPGTATLTNVALRENGGTASASSQLSADFPIASINDGERAGRNWTHGGGWADGTMSAWPDWVQVDFGAPTNLSSVVVYTVQDNYQAPIEPTDTTTFTQYGITDFNVQGWDGNQWVTLATVTGNNLVKRTVTFAPVTTTKIRVNVTNALYYVSRITEVEAWGIPAAPALVNVAAASNGGVASASSQLGNAYPVGAINDGRRSSRNWTNGGGWADGTVGQWPDWVQVDFNAAKSVSRVVVYTVPDDYAHPVEPTDAMTFSQYGVTDFDVQGWDGAQWVTLATVTGNNLVKRTVAFAPFTTTKIRINVTNAMYYVSRIVEVEAWGVPAAPAPVNVALQAFGANAVASSTLGYDYPAYAVNQGNCAGRNWTHGGGWADGTVSQWPDWVQVNFDLAKTISRVVVCTVQDDYANAIEPTDSTTFTKYGITDFQVQAWDGSQWVTLGAVAANNLVKRTVTFAPFTTNAVRVNVTGALSYVSRITDVQAWGR